MENKIITFVFHVIKPFYNSFNHFALGPIILP
jgi:hypothetical protein